MNRLSHLVGLIVFCLALMTSGLNAQSTITIGTGTAFSETFPLNGYYNYSWSNSIYLANQIGKSGSLSSIAFFVDNTSANIVMNNQKIYVRHTGATSYSNSTYQGPAGFTLVYDGAITINGQGWKTITFNTPFNYNGTENLEFLFENRDGSYVTTFPYYQYTSTGSGAANIRTRRDYQDATFPSACYTCGTVNAVPNMQFTITPCTFDSGVVTSDSTSVVPGNMATVTLTGQAAGATIQWQSSDDNLVFYNIPGATLTTYSEIIYSTKYYRAILTYQGCSKVSTTATVNVDLRTMITKSVGAGTAVTEKYPFNEYYNNSWSNMIYKASDIQGSGKLSRVAFNVSNSPVNVTMPNQKIYVKTVPNTTVAYTTSNYPTTAGFTLVYDGPITFNGSGWKEIVFNKGEFYYNGTDNLEFLFESRNGAYTNDYPTFYTSIGGQTDYSLRRDYKDYDFPSTCYSCGKFQNTLNIRLSFFPCTSVAGTASAENPTVCTSKNTTIKLLGTTTGSTIQWQSSTNNSTFTDIIGATTSTYITPNLSVTTYYKAVVKKGVCTTTSNTVTVTVSAAECLLTTSEIGTGTVTFDKYPFNGYYDYSWASMLYKASEINSTGKLARVSFYVDNDPVNETMNNQKIYVRHANTSEYTDAVHPTTAGFTLVYDGSITYNGSGWKEIAFQNQFEYNGVDDLEFLFENRDGSWTATHPIFRGQGGMSQDRVKRDYNDVTFPATCVNCAKYNNILNIKMKFIPCSINGGTVSATATNVKPLENVQLTLTGQENAGTIQWEQSTDNVTFTVVPNQNGNTLTIPMTVSNLYVRTVTKLDCSKYSNVVTITPDNCFQVSPQIGNGILESYKFPFNVWYDYSWSSTIYTKEEVGPAGKIASMSFNVTNSPVNYVTNNQKIYVRKTDARQFDDATYSGTTGFTNVFEGTITYNGQGWKEIVFTTPFEYDGTSNLEFLFENRDGSYGDSYPKFAYTDGQILNRTKRDFADNAFPATCVTCLQGMNVPNTKFKFLAPANVAGTVSATATEVCAGQTSVLSVEGQIAGSTLQWQSSSDNVSFVNIDGATANTYTTGEITATTYYRAVVSVGVCSVNSAVVTVALNCPVSMIFNNETSIGSVEVDIASIIDKVGPFHYVISENPIEELTETFRYMRDTIFGDTIPLDSLAFFKGQYTDTKHKFEDLEMGEYFIVAFDSRGVRLLTKKTKVMPTIAFQNNKGLSIKNGEITSSQALGSGIQNIYVNEQTNGGITYQISDPKGQFSVGLIEVSSENPGDIKFGFKGVNGFISIYNNGLLEATRNIMSTTTKLTIQQNENKIDLLVNGLVVSTSQILTPNYVYRVGTILGTGSILNQTPFGITTYNFTIPTYITTSTCTSLSSNLTLNISNINFHGFTLTPHLTLFNGLSAVGSLNQSVFNNLANGIYTLSGTLTFGSTSWIINQQIYVGAYLNWDQLQNVYSTATAGDDAIGNSLISGNVYGQAIAKNTLNYGTAGWLVVTPKINTSGANKLNRLVFSVAPTMGTQPNTYEIPNLLFYSNSYKLVVLTPNPTAQMFQMSIINYQPNSPLLIQRKSDGTVIIKQKNNLLYSTNAFAYFEELRWRPSVIINKPNSGFNNIITSFNCTNIDEQYAQLKYDLDGYYHIMKKGKIQFVFNQEYDASTLKFKIYNQIDVLVKDQTNFTSVPVSFGDNYITLDVSSDANCIGKGYFYLEITNDKKEKSYLRFFNDYNGICLIIEEQ